MAAAKLISTPKLLEYIEQEVGEKLAARELHDIGSYGWEDESTPDPQFLGHAMWQVEPPLQLEHSSAFGGAPVRHRPTDEREVLAVSGADFEGLMRLSRMSIGLGLWHQQLAENAMFEDNDHFWLHYLSAVVLLNAASDRLREFFVMALFRQKTAVYDRKKGTLSGNEYRWYQTPFIEAKDSKDLSMGSLLENLSMLAEKIYEHREARNEIVHEIGTKIGRRERELTRQQRTRFDEQQRSSAVLEKPQHVGVAERFAKLRNRTKSNSGTQWMMLSLGTRHWFRRAAMLLRSKTICVGEGHARKGMGSNFAMHRSANSRLRRLLPPGDCRR